MDQTRWFQKSRSVWAHTVPPLFCREKFGERRKETRPGITYGEGSRLVPPCEGYKRAVERREKIATRCAYACEQEEHHDHEV